jgi:D-lactate dehydrogenase
VNAVQDPLELTFLEARLDPHTALLAKGHEAVCIFVNDDGGAETLEVLASVGVKLIVLRVSRGFMNLGALSNETSRV